MCSPIRRGPLPHAQHLSHHLCFSLFPQVAGLLRGAARSCQPRHAMSSAPLPRLQGRPAQREELKETWQPPLSGEKGGERGEAVYRSGPPPR
ncbi:hypothetical protein NDU88_004492 [Pleurodeles waltl]|uniref:Uncharacterized protein n=1 Tax=Pleurodeles waltl TaxID=8319 RepID=A0AAV7MWJ2_PLEWA|nr:hypothetical protein NDU88_004492 [Pleurodeles waltl]